MHTALMQNLRWMRLFGDTIFAVGAVAFFWFALDLMLRKPKAESAVLPAGEMAEA